MKVEKSNCNSRGGSRTAAGSKKELFVIIVNGLKPLTIITKSSILDVAAILDPPLNRFHSRSKRIEITVGLSPSKKIVLFASMKSL